MKSNALTNFESAIIQAIYAQERPTESIPKLSVVHREFSGSGIFVSLHADQEQHRAEGNATLGKQLHFEITGLPHGGGALLYIGQGKPELLEIYVNGSDEWPDVVTEYRIEYRL